MAKLTEIAKYIDCIEIPYVLDKGAFAPEKAHDTDAGMDLRTPVDLELLPGQEVTVDLGVHMAIPEGYVGFLKSKSGLNVKQGVTSEGVIDAGYTGSIVAKLRRDASQKTKLYFEPGDKITQIVILPIPKVELRRVTSLEKTERGNGGFGSTGIK